MGMVCKVGSPNLSTNLLCWGSSVKKFSSRVVWVRLKVMGCALSAGTSTHVHVETLGLPPPKLQNARSGCHAWESTLQRVRTSIRSQADSKSQLPTGERKHKDFSSQLELGRADSVQKKKTAYNGIFLLLLLNLGIYAADHWLQIPAIRMLYLYHDAPKWYQFVTSTFCHINWTHLSSNLFFLYIFGKLVEEEEGSLGVWTSFFITGVGANFVSWLILPRTVVSAGASGAVFGLFAVSVLVKLSWDWRKILEVLILGQFVVDKVMEAAQASAHLGGKIYSGSANINHIAHLSGALLGVALIYLLSRLPNGSRSK